MGEHEHTGQEACEDDESFPRPSIGSEAGLGESGQIGRYKLLSVLGEGGFGVVYLAEQREPVRRQVAVKVIKPGMDSRQVIARFEAERQALALLDHPNIAHVFDGGSTEAGRPYFVMELVTGLPITEYCDKHRLNIEERLGLFTQICEGVQHAHQKGIIHRDIKPSNILVSEQEGKPVPKIIDFGVAKAVGQPLTERTLFTEQGQFVGTPEYMSPEQASLTTEHIDARSDVYSLGVILYELLTGTLPFSQRELEKANLAEIQRIIRETDPPRPSTRLSSLGEDGKKVAEHRRTNITALTKRVHRELEWIPLKAMRKGPDRRYKTASELADDVRNYLRGDPLIAGPESMAYRAKKLARKYAAVIASAAAIFVVLVVGFVVSTIMYVEADKAHNEESIQRRNAEAMVAFLQSANRLDLSGSPISGMDLERLAGSHALRSLAVPHTQINNADLAHLRDMVSLEGLFLGDTRITDGGLVHVQNLTALKSLCVHETQVGDAGLACLKNLHSLQYLCLANTKVTDAGLVHLKGLSSLKDLRLGGTRVTKAGIQELGRSLRYCKIYSSVLSPTVVTQIPVENLRIPEDLRACADNLRRIDTAIKRYEADTGRLPDWLSNLVPRYLNKEALLCPDHRDRRSPRLDPNLPCGYDYDFAPVRDQYSLVSYRQWKMRQVEKYGNVVPVVRCMHHSGVGLNLSDGGEVYWSPPAWEDMFNPNRHDAVPDPGPRQLVARWEFDEADGLNVPDLSGNGHKAMLVGTARIVNDAQRGNVLRLDGSNDSYVDCGDSVDFDIRGPITVAAWIKVNEFNKFCQSIITKGYWTWGLQRDGENNGINFTCMWVQVEGTKDCCVAGTTSVNDGRWHSVAGVYDGNKMCIFVDGVLDTSSNASGHIYTIDFPVLIGANWQLPGREWDGLIDDVRIYNFGLTAQQIQALYRGADPTGDPLPPNAAIDSTPRSKIPPDKLVIPQNLPDLVIESLIHAPANPNTADVITFTAVVKNVGYGKAGSSTLAMWVGGASWPRTSTVPALEPGKTHQVEWRATIDIGQRYGNTATADFKNEVEESNETNNQKTDVFEVYE